MQKLIRLLITAMILVMPIKPQQQTITNKETITCLAEGIYFEAGNQSNLGKQAVAWVIFNRSKDWNLSICETVHQKVGRSCQFVWYCRSARKTPNNKNWKDSYKLAEDMLSNENNHYVDVTKGAKYFHASYVSPNWRKSKIFTVRIQNHLFYR